MADKETAETKPAADAEEKKFKGPPKSIFRGENGLPLEIDAAGAGFGSREQAGLIFVDGVEVGDIEDVALRDRRMLSADGIFIVVATISEQDGRSVVPPEIIFRGVALTAWARTFGERSGILRSALFFALAHVILVGGATVGEAAGLTVVGFASRLPVALLLGWVFVRRRSIYAAIGLHAAFNAVLLVISEVAAGAVAEG